MNADILVGGALVAWAAWYLVRGWLRARRTVANGLALIDPATLDARRRHPSNPSRPVTYVAHSPHGTGAGREAAC